MLSSREVGSRGFVGKGGRRGGKEEERRGKRVSLMRDGRTDRQTDGQTAVLNLPVRGGLTQVNLGQVNVDLTNVGATLRKHPNCILHPDLEGAHGRLSHTHWPLKSRPRNTDQGTQLLCLSLHPKDSLWKVL